MCPFPPQEALSKPITVTVEEKRVQRVKPGADVTFICTAKSKVRAGLRQGSTVQCEEVAGDSVPSLGWH